MLVGGELAGQLAQSDLTESPHGVRILKLLKYIDNDPFWKAQISGLEINLNGDILFHPQVTKQIVAFGKAENIEAKFKKLDIFYREILPQKGWNHYRTVNLKYHNQIVCE